LIDEKRGKAELEVDGGLKIGNIQEISNAGCDIFVAGSAIFKSRDYAETISQMKKLL
jgi:ribulose-phosphate 3-epimerase